MDLPAIGATIIGVGLFVIVPVVAIMAEHQRKMARIMHAVDGKSDQGQGEKDALVIGLHAGLGPRKSNSADNAVLEELRALRGELADLKLHVASINGNSTPPPPPHP